MHKYQKLTVWQRSMDLCTEVYKAASGLPADERFGLVSQIRRSAVSIPSNIAEGAGRGGNKEFLHFLNLANGSSFELETQLLLCQRLNLLDHLMVESMLQNLSEIKKMNYALQLKLKE